MDFGAFVNFFGSKDGLVHISQLGQGRVQKTSDVVKEGDKVKVKLLGVDDRGKVRLSMKVVDQKPARTSRPSKRPKAPNSARWQAASKPYATSTNTKGGLRAAFFVPTRA